VFCGLVLPGVHLGGGLCGHNGNRDRLHTANESGDARSRVGRELRTLLSCLTSRFQTPRGSNRLLVVSPAFLAYSSFGIGADRKHALKWLFPQEKATFHRAQKSTC